MHNDVLRATRLPARLLPDGAVEIDARGTFCPVPLIEAQRVARRLVGGVLVVLADDPDAPTDFADWADATGHRVEVEGDAKGCRIRVIL